MKLPKLNLHIHSIYSDGRNTIEQIVKKALKTGLFSDYQSNQKLVFNPENREIFEQLKQEAGLGGISDWGLDSEELERKGIELDLFDY